ncbi:MAG: tetratricopeptide repeat protein, partial [Limisphaerales bacterium]
MKRLFALLLALSFVVLPAAQAQRLDDDYVKLFNLIQEADSLSSAQPSQALLKYREAQQGLERLKRSSPDWNPKVVAFRLSYVASKIAAIVPQTPANPPAQTAEPIPTPSSPAQNDLQLQLNASNEQIRQLQSERANLEAKLKEALALRPAEADPGELARAQQKVTALQKENDLLKITVENEKSKLVASAPAPAANATGQQALDQAQRELAQEKELNSKLALEKQALSQQVAQLATKAAAPETPPAVAENSARLQQLERERDLLQKELQQANGELGARKAKPRARQVKDLENQLADLRVRLDSLEAIKVPYSAEELALFKPPATALSTAQPGQAKASREFPPGSGPLVSEAQRYFAAQQFDKAEEAYLQVLKLDEKNVPALANLAAIQVEAKHYDAAEGTLNQALSVASDDAYTLYVQGLLKFRQTKYDDALDALSRAAKLDPKNPEVQNYLGLT